MSAFRGDKGKMVHRTQGGRVYPCTKKQDKQNVQLKSEIQTHSSADIRRGLIYSKPSNSD